MDDDIIHVRREGGREGGSEGGKEGREGGRDGGREGGREGRRERGWEGEREGGRKGEKSTIKVLAGERKMATSQFIPSRFSLPFKTAPLPLHTYLFRNQS